MMSSRATGYANACYAAGGDTFGIMMLCRSATIFGLTVSARSKPCQFLLESDYSIPHE